MTLDRRPVDAINDFSSSSGPDFSAAVAVTPAGLEGDQASRYDADRVAEFAGR